MQSIAIIGGGYTGLMAAYRLAQEGKSVTIYESSQALGGLAGEVEIEGAKIERFYHHVFKSDTSILNLIDELNNTNKGKKHPIYVKKVKSSVGVVIDKNVLPFNGALDLLKFNKVSFLTRIRLGIVALYLSKVKNKREWDTIPAANWMQKACGEEGFNTIWRPLLQGKFDSFWDKVSMNWLWARIYVRANSRSSLFEDEMLHYIEGGFGRLVDRLEEELISLGVTIKTSAPVQKITYNKGKVIIITQESKQTFNACISTTSNHLFLEMTKDDLRSDHPYYKKLRGINYLGAVCIMFSSNQSLSNFYWHNINNSDSPYMVVIEHTNFIPKDNYNQKSVYYLAKYTQNKAILEADDKMLTQQWFDYLKKIFPSFDKKLVRQVVVSKAPYAQHVADTEYAKNIPDHKTPLKNVWLYNFSQIYPYDRGTNYAIAEGEKAAKELQSFSDI